jgi:hypothetical protein
VSRRPRLRRLSSTPKGGVQHSLCSRQMRTCEPGLVVENQGPGLLDRLTPLARPGCPKVCITRLQRTKPHGLVTYGGLMGQFSFNQLIN